MNAIMEHSPSEQNELIQAATAVLQLTYPDITVENTQSYAGHDSVKYSNPVEKTICRVLSLLHDINDTHFSSMQLITPNALKKLVNHIDQCTPRDYLYEAYLLQDCHLLIPEEIPVNAPWEEILKPVQRFLLNRAYIHNPITAMGLGLLIMSITRVRSGNNISWADVASLPQLLAPYTDYLLIPQLFAQTINHANPNLINCQRPEIGIIDVNPAYAPTPQLTENN